MTWPWTTPAQVGWLRARGIPFLFATGYAEGGVGWDGEAVVIAKPYSRDQLARAIAGLLA